MELRSKSSLNSSISLDKHLKSVNGRHRKKGKYPNNFRETSDARTIEFSCPNYTCDFLSQLYQLYQQGICCDVVLSAGEYQTSTHKIVLVASSEYFRSLFITPDCVKDFVILPADICSEALQSMMSYMYTGSLYLNEENIKPMMSAAIQLQIKSAIELCHQFLDYKGLKHLLDFPVPLLPEEPIFPFNQNTEFVIKEEVQNTEETQNEDKVQSSCLFENQQLEEKVKKCADRRRAKAAVARIKKSKSKLQQKTSHVQHKRNGSRAQSKIQKYGKASSQAANISELRSPTTSSTETLSDSPTMTMRCPELSPGISKPRSTRKSKSSSIRSSVSEIITKRVRGRKVVTVGQVLLETGSLFKCRICQKGYQRNSGLLVHMRARHCVSVSSVAVRTSRGLLQASVKRLRYSAVSEMTSMSTIHSCHFCRLQFRLRARLSAHLLIRHSENIKSKEGHEKVSLRKRSGARKWKALVLPRVHKCGYCNRPFVHQSSLASHYLIRHKRIKKEDYSDVDEIPRGRRPRSTWSCKETDCGAACSCMSELKEHMATKHPDVIYSCPDCRFTCQVERIFQRHRIQRHGKKQVCDLCGKTCPKLCLLKRHMFTHHRIKDPTLKLYQCSFEGCNYECCYKDRLAAHFVRHTVGKSLKCDVCGKAFKHTLGLQRHVNTIHFGIRPFICDQCGTGFGTEGELKVHVTRHSKNKPFSCDYCAYSTFAKVNLQGHLLSRHKIETRPTAKKVQPLKCNQCDFTTDRKGYLDDHLKKHLNIRDIPCRECGKLFITKRNLHGHMVTVHRPKTLHCTFCNYSSSLLSAFKDHVRIMHTHRHEKRYECPMCKFRSATSGNCRKHIQGTHKDFEMNPKYVGPPRMMDLRKKLIGEKDEPTGQESDNLTLNLSCKV